jgi:hypothetical protein
MPPALEVEDLDGHNFTAGTAFGLGLGDRMATFWHEIMESRF